MNINFCFRASATFRRGCVLFGADLSVPLYTSARTATSQPSFRGESMCAFRRGLIRAFVHINVEGYRSAQKSSSAYPIEGRSRSSVVS
jgi:hypothetical protein